MPQCDLSTKGARYEVTIDGKLVLLPVARCSGSVLVSHRRERRHPRVNFRIRCAARNHFAVLDDFPYPWRPFWGNAICKTLGHAALRQPCFQTLAGNAAWY
jgi:hypothetical protein